MIKELFEDKELIGINFSDKPLSNGDYENCLFKNCNFSNTNLSQISFTDCVFENCDLSLVKTIKTGFKNVNFKNTKLLGVHFENCNKFLFWVNFNACQLNLSSFYKLVLKGIKFKNCTLHEVDFSEANLSNATFDNCDLNGAIFEYTNLSNADFRSSFHFSIDPESNNIKKAKFSLAGIQGLLNKYDIEID